MKLFIDTKNSSLAVEKKKVRTTHSERQELLNVEETESTEEKRLSIDEEERFESYQKRLKRRVWRRLLPGKDPV